MRVGTMITHPQINGHEFEYKAFGEYVCRKVHMVSNSHVILITMKEINICTNATNTDKSYNMINKW